MDKARRIRESMTERQPYDYQSNPCTKDCPDRKAECAKTCTKWAKYAAGRVERYEYNKKVYEVQDALRWTSKRLKTKGQL